MDDEDYEGDDIDEKRTEAMKKDPLLVAAFNAGWIIDQDGWFVKLIKQEDRKVIEDAFAKTEEVMCGFVAKKANKVVVSTVEECAWVDDVLARNENNGCQKAPEGKDPNTDSGVQIRSS